MNKFQRSVLISIAIFFVLILAISLMKKIPKEEVPIAPVETVDPIPAETVVPKKESSGNKNPLLINNISVDVAPTVKEESKTPAVNVNVQSTEPQTSGDIFEDQENTSMPKQEKLYSITPQKGSPLKPRENITLEQLRDYVIQTNYQIVAFREKMATASEVELIDYLKANGFTVEIK